MYENNTRITFEKLTILRFQTSQCPQFCQSPIFNNFFVFDNQYKKKCIGSYANSRQSSALSCHKSNKKTKILYLIIFFVFDYQYKKVEWFLHGVGNPLNQSTTVWFLRNGRQSDTRDQLHFLAINQIQSNQIKFNPIKSNPIQSNPIQSILALFCISSRFYCHIPLYAFLCVIALCKIQWRPGNASIATVRSLALVSGRKPQQRAGSVLHAFLSRPSLMRLHRGPVLIAPFYSHTVRAGKRGQRVGSAPSASKGKGQEVSTSASKG